MSEISESILQMAKDQSFGSKSYASSTMRATIHYHQQEQQRYKGVVTDIRKMQNPIESEIGRVMDGRV